MRAVLSGCDGLMLECNHDRRMLIAGPVVAMVSVLAALLATHAAGLPLRDPDHVAGRRLVLVVCLVAVLIGLKVLVGAGRRSRTLGGIPPVGALPAV